MKIIKILKEYIMTKEEMQIKTEQKVQAIKTLCNQLGVRVSAKQMVTNSGMIENVVSYEDLEQYPEDKAPTAEKIKIKKNEKTSNIRK